MRLIRVVHDDYLFYSCLVDDAWDLREGVETYALKIMFKKYGDRA